MNTLLELLLSNLAVASLLALVAAAVQRWGRRPALAHGLWLLVLLKLVTPPLVRLPILSPAGAATAEPLFGLPLTTGVTEAIPIELAAAPGLFAQAPEAPADAADPIFPQVFPPADHAKREAAPLPQANNPLPAAVAAPAVAPAEGGLPQPSSWSWWIAPALAAVWVLGSLAWFFVAARRLLRFHRLLALGQPAPAEVQDLARWLAERMRISCPRIVMVPGQLSPLLWTLGGASRLVLPQDLLARLNPDQWGTLLAHELAHYKRRDHWVRWLELLVIGLYWWCPLAWWARRGLQQAEEECCDAWVVWTLPGAARSYALALVETVDFLAGARASLPPAASGLGHVRLLKRRLNMILRGSTPRALTLGGVALLVALGVLLLPLVPGRAQDPVTGQNKIDPDVKKVDPKEKPEPKDVKPVDPKEPKDPKDAQAELRQIQEEMRKLQEDFQKKQRALMERMMKLTGRPGFPPIGPIGDPTLPPAVPFPPIDIKIPDIKLPVFPGGGGDVERRLQELERKIDMLMRELLKKTPGKGPNNVPPDAPIRNPGNPGNAPAPNATPAPGAPAVDPAARPEPRPEAR